MNQQQLLMLAALLKSDDPEMLVKAAASVNTATLVTQPGGMFAVAGMETDVISTHVTPRGIGASLPVYTSYVTDPYYGIFTGYTAETGARPVTPCEDGPSGSMKAGVLTASFGRVQHDTKTIEIDTVLDQTRGVNNNLRLLGEIYGNGVFGGSDAAPNSPQQILNLVVMSEMVGVGVQFERDLAKLTWQGNPANNTAQGGHKEFNGLDRLIKTGHVDAESSTAMAAADSHIVAFAHNLVTGTTKDIVEEMLATEHYLYHLADRTGLSPVTWKIVMRPELWYELTKVWPSRYLSNNATNFAGTNVMAFNDGSTVRERDRMRQTLQIDLNGRTYEVITDDGIYFDDNVSDSGNYSAGQYGSSIYFLPTMVSGNFPSMYWEHKSYTAVPAQIAPMGAGVRNTEFWTDNGRFLWAYDSNGFCFKLKAKCEPRILLRTPHLAAKIQNIKYVPTKALRSPFPADATFVQGGVSSR